MRTERTELLQIMLAVRSGLNLMSRDYVAAHYTAASVITVFRWHDRKLYQIEIKEIKATGDLGGTDENGK